MTRALKKRVDRALAAAATLTGRRFGLLVASSVVATSAIVASAMTNPSGSAGPLAALLGRSLAADRAPEAPSPAPQAESTGRPAAAREASSVGPRGSAGGAPPASAVPEPAPAPISEPAPETEASNTPAPTAAPPEAGRVKHVFVVTLSSPGYEAAFGDAGQMPYLATTLRPQGELLSRYSLLDDSGPLPNDLAAVGGQVPSAETKAGCPEYEKCLYPVEELSLADQLTAARFTWGAYMDGMVDETGKPDTCAYPSAEATEPPAPGSYSATRNPFVYFHSLLDLGDCALYDVSLTKLQAALHKPGATPTYSFIAPSPCNAGVSGQCPEGAPSGAAAADAFLATWVPKILASPAYKKDGLLIVAFDQVDPAAATPAAVPANPVPPRQVGALLLSPFVSPGSTDAKPYSPYSLLRSTEDLFGLTHLGRAGGAKVPSFAAPLLGEAGGD